MWPYLDALALLLCLLVHHLCRQLQQAHKHSPPEVIIKVSLVIDDVDMPRGQANLRREVGKVGRDAAPQALQKRVPSCMCWYERFYRRFLLDSSAKSTFTTAEPMSMNHKARKTALHDTHTEAHLITERCSCRDASLFNVFKDGF